MNMSLLNLSFLGEVQIVLDERPLTETLIAKEQALLCYLVVTGQPHTRHALAGLLWGDVPEKKAKNSLRVALAKLRNVIPDHLTVSWQTVAFNKESHYQLDVAAFAAQTNAPVSEEQSGLQTAVDLYRGEFMEGFSLEDAPEFEEWLASQRAHWRQQALTAMERLGDAYVAQKAYGKAVAVMQRLLALEPLHEHAHRQLMLAWSRGGDYEQALAQYEACRRRLSEELDVAPMPETTALYERIRVAQSGCCHTLPAQTTPFVGRETELAQLGGLLADPDCRLLTLVGLGGTGKTRLALEAARRANGDGMRLFLNGVVFVPLTAVGTSALLSTTLAQSLGLPLSGHHDPLTQVLDYLRNKEMLLLLDNFDHLLEESTLLAQILSVSPGTKILATSRDPLQLQMERRFDVTGLDYPQTGAEDLTAYSAVQLFLQAARQAREAFALTAENREAVAEICRLLAGNPLAIRLAASWLRTRSCAEIAAEIERNLDFLAAAMPDIPQRQRSMRVVFDYTWQALSPQEQGVFAGLSVFRGGFTAAAAHQIVNASPYLLAGLVDKSLLQLQRTEQETRYQMHGLTQQYAAGKLRQWPQEVARIDRDHCRYYATFLQQQAPHLHNEKQKEAYETLRREADNIRAAWRYAVAHGEKAYMVASLDALYDFYLFEDWFQEGSDLFGQALQLFAADSAGHVTGQELAAKLQARQGVFFAFQGLFKRGAEQLERSLHAARAMDASEEVVFALTWLAHCANQQDDLEQARALEQEALAICEALDDWRACAGALNVAGLTDFYRQAYGEAKEKLLAALKMYRERNHFVQMTAVLNNLSLLALVTGYFGEAKTYAEEALAIMEMLGSRLRLSTTLIHLGHAQVALGNLAAARRHFTRSLAICEEVGNEFKQANALECLGIVALDMGDYGEAQRLLEESLRLNKMLGKSKYMAFNYDYLGRLALETADYATARRYHQSSYAIWQALKHREGQAIALNFGGRAAQALGQQETARRHYLQALSLARQIGAESLTMSILVNWASYWAHQEAHRRAARLLSFVVAQKTTAHRDRHRAQCLLAAQTAVLPPALLAEIKEEAQALALAQIVDEIRVNEEVGDGLPTL